MTFTNEELKILEDVPECERHTLLQFAHFLIVSQPEQENVETDKPVRHGEWVQGEIWMSEDFNAPLEFVSSDEIRVLNVMRETKQEAAV